jgi:hypothetical protein
MILFLADGRFGNQIFQYMFLKILQKDDEHIFVLGFEDLISILDIKDIVNFNKKNRWIRSAFNRVLKPFLLYLADKKIISSVEVIHENVLNVYQRESTEYIYTEGFFKNLTFVKLAFFQSESFFDEKLVNYLQTKNKFILDAQDFLQNFTNKYKVFVHIRRGDYKEYKVYGKSTLLPMEYFHKQIKWFIENRQNVKFVFLSDEPSFIEKEFMYLDNKIISNNSFEVDFAIMTLCNGAILSPSSFGWWGSYLMQDRDVVFAPKYWLGFYTKEEYHKNSIASFMEEREI